MQSCYRKVTDHLGNVRLVKYGHYFGIYYHEIVNDQIRNQLSDFLSLILNREQPLLLHRMTTITQFDHQGIFI